MHCFLLSTYRLFKEKLTICAITHRQANILAAAIIALGLACRIPLLEHTPFEWDSVNLILAVEQFDLGQDRPHPPGYIGFVLLGKALNLLIDNPHLSLLILNFFALCFLLLGIYRLVKEIYSIKTALSALVVTTFNPIVWFYGEIVSTYLAGAALWMWLVILIRKIGNGKSAAFPGGLLMGLAGGIRPDVAVFLLPAAVRANKIPLFSSSNLRLILGFVLGGLIWLLPTMTLMKTGYFSALTTIFAAAGERFSIFFGGTAVNHLIMIGKGIIWLTIGIWWIFPLLVISAYRRKFRLIDTELLLLTAILPLMLLQFLFHIIKPGYILLYLPGLLVLGTGLLSKMKKGRYYYLTFLTMINLGYFLFTPAKNSPPGAVGGESTRISYYMSRLNSTAYSRIKYSDRYGLTLQRDIRCAYSPENTALIAAGKDYDWRKITYLLPEFYTIQGGDGGFVQAAVSGRIVPLENGFALPPQIKILIFLTEDQGWTEKVSPVELTLKTSPGGLVWREGHLP